MFKSFRKAPAPPPPPDAEAGPCEHAAYLTKLTFKQAIAYSKKQAATFFLRRNAATGDIHWSETIATFQERLAALPDTEVGETWLQPAHGELRDLLLSNSSLQPALLVIAILASIPDRQLLLVVPPAFLAHSIGLGDNFHTDGASALELAIKGGRKMVISSLRKFEERALLAEVLVMVAPELARIPAGEAKMKTGEATSADRIAQVGLLALPLLNGRFINSQAAKVFNKIRGANPSPLPLHLFLSVAPSSEEPTASAVTSAADKGGAEVGASAISLLNETLGDDEDDDDDAPIIMTLRATQLRPTSDAAEAAAKRAAAAAAEDADGVDLAAITAGTAEAGGAGPPAGDEDEGFPLEETILAMVPPILSRGIEPACDDIVLSPMEALVRTTGVLARAFPLACISTGDKQQQTPLHLAAAKPRGRQTRRLIAQLLSVDSTSVAHTTRDGDSPLTLLLKRDTAQARLAAALSLTTAAAQGFDPLLENTRSGLLPLHIAAKSQRSSGGRLFLALMAEAAPTTICCSAPPSGLTPLHCAAQIGSHESLRLLLYAIKMNAEDAHELPPSLDMEDCNGLWPLEAASSRACVDEFLHYNPHMGDELRVRRDNGKARSSHSHRQLFGWVEAQLTHLERLRLAPQRLRDPVRRTVVCGAQRAGKTSFIASTRLRPTLTVARVDKCAAQVFCHHIATGRLSVAAKKVAQQSHNWAMYLGVALTVAAAAATAVAVAQDQSSAGGRSRRGQKHENMVVSAKTQRRVKTVADTAGAATAAAGFVKVWKKSDTREEEKSRIVTEMELEKLRKEISADADAEHRQKGTVYELTACPEHRPLQEVLLSQVHSCYVIIIDASEPAEVQVAQLKAWLWRLVTALGSSWDGGEQHTHARAQALVVGSHMDLAGADLTAMQSTVDELASRYRTKLAITRDVCAYNCVSPSEEQLALVQKRLDAMYLQIKDNSLLAPNLVQDEIFALFRTIGIETPVKDARSLLSIAGFKDWEQFSEDGLLSEEAQSALRFLNATGDVLYHPDLLPFPLLDTTWFFEQCAQALLHTKLQSRSLPTPGHPFVLASVDVAKSLFPGVKHPEQAVTLLMYTDMSWPLHESEAGTLLAIPSLVQATPAQVQHRLQLSSNYTLRLKLVAQDAGMPAGSLKRAALKLLAIWREQTRPDSVEIVLDAVEVWWNGFAVSFPAQGVVATVTTFCTPTEETGDCGCNGTLRCGGLGLELVGSPMDGDAGELGMEAKRFVECLAADLQVATFGQEEVDVSRL